MASRFESIRKPLFFEMRFGHDACRFLCSVDMSDSYPACPHPPDSFVSCLQRCTPTCLPGKRTSDRAFNHDRCGAIKHESSLCQRRLRSAQTSSWWHLHKRAFPLAVVNRICVSHFLLAGLISIALAKSFCLTLTASGKLVRIPARIVYPSTTTAWP